MNRSQAPVAYLVSEYPSRSHTFIRRERYALMNKGVNIEMLAIRRCSESDIKNESERTEFDTTWAILPISPLALLGVVAKRFIRSPIAFLSTLKYAWQHRLPGVKNGLWSLFYFVESLVVSKQLENINAKHLHVHFAIASARIGVLCHKLIDIPWSMTLHGACDFEFPAGPLLGQKLETVSFAACVSHYGRSQAMRTLQPEHWEKLQLVRCGVELDQLAPEDTLTHDKGATELYCVGRLSAEKGQLGLLEAFSVVLKDFPDVTLNIIGYGPDEAKLKARSEELGIASSIKWLGAKTESGVISELRENAHMLLLPSFMEGVPMVLMEAMANGVNVVAPRIAGIPELVEDNMNGLLYHPADWDGMADNIKALLSDQALRLSLKKNAWSKVRDEFCVESSVDNLAQLLLNSGK